MTLQRTSRPIAQHRSADVCLLGMGTAAPMSVAQSLAADLSEPLCCDDDKQRSFFRRVYEKSGVNFRGSVIADRELAGDPMPDEQAVTRAVRKFYPLRSARAAAADCGPTTGQRMALYAAEAPKWASRSAGAALASSALEPQQITHLITASCTGFFAPGLDVELIQRLGLRPDVQRQHLGFMGCHAAFNALAAAQSIARARVRAHAHARAGRQARVLVCCTELCSLHLAYGFDPGKIVANALFADGSAAAVISSPEAPSPATTPLLRHAASLLLSGSPDAMTWTIGDHGFEMTLSAEVPALIREHVPAWVRQLLADHGMELSDVQHYAIHPGGPKILSAVAEALNINDRGMQASRQILADHGNMSSATILFVLEQLQRQGAQGPCLALGFGPGLMAEALLLDL